LRRDTIKTAKPGPGVRAMVSDEDAPLLSALKAKRRALAEAQGVPAYIIFNDRTLVEMAETRPRTLDDMARLSGIGAKKLDSYGQAFLQVITGEAEQMHPARARLAGRDEGTLYDRLLEVQADLSRGPEGTEKPMTCSAALLARVARQKPRDASAMARLLGDRYADRFGAAFLDVIAGE
jgi:ATP-dependent DNA helicase RecQ